MQYRIFGDTGLTVSALGSGAMRLPRDETEGMAVVRRAVELGVNYIDTAPGYVDGKSEVIVGKAIKGMRDKLIISTKNPIENASGADWTKRLENSLRQLDTDYIDFYHMWGISWSAWENSIDVPNGPLEAAHRAKEKGLVRHISFSFHSSPDDLVKLVDTGAFESVLCQYNLLDRANETGIAHAKAQGLGVVIMGPVAGGRLGKQSDVVQQMIPGGTKTSAELALRFVLANQNVSIALSGMSSIQQVEENAATASRVEALSTSEKAALETALEQVKKLADLYCTGCDYCTPCPNGVDIPGNFRSMNYHLVYGLTDLGKSGYNRLRSKNRHAEVCEECGVCEDKCPQKIHIMEQLRETAVALR